MQNVQKYNKVYYLLVQYDVIMINSDIRFERNNDDVLFYYYFTVFIFQMVCFFI